MEEMNEKEHEKVNIWLAFGNFADLSVYDTDTAGRSK